MTWRADLIEAAAKAAYEGGQALSRMKPGTWDDLHPQYKTVFRTQVEASLPVIADALAERGWSAAAAELRGEQPKPIHDPDDYPDGWTLTSNGKPQSDSQRDKQIGNSIAVPVFEWVARRIAAVDEWQQRSIA